MESDSCAAVSALELGSSQIRTPSSLAPSLLAAHLRIDRLAVNLLTLIAQFAQFAQFAQSHLPSMPFNSSRSSGDEDAGSQPGDLRGQCVRVDRRRAEVRRSRSF